MRTYAPAVVTGGGVIGGELHRAAADQRELCAALLRAGRDLGAGPVGSRALMSLRVEKGYGSWGRGSSPEDRPQDLGLDRRVKADKGFLSKAAWEAIRREAPRQVTSLPEIDATVADAAVGEPVFLPDGTPTGQVSSGEYGHSVGKPLAIAYLKAGLAAPGDSVHAAILGRPHSARVLPAPAFDPEGLRLRDLAPAGMPAQ